MYISTARHKDLMIVFSWGAWGLHFVNLGFPRDLGMLLFEGPGHSGLWGSRAQRSLGACGL